jgi:hypothetical protein
MVINESKPGLISLIVSGVYTVHRHTVVPKSWEVFWQIKLLLKNYFEISEIKNNFLLAGITSYFWYVKHINQT